MQTLFQDLPEALENTLKVADKCHVELDFDSKHYPKYEAPSLKDTDYNDDEKEPFKIADSFAKKISTASLIKVLIANALK